MLNPDQSCGLRRDESHDATMERYLLRREAEFITRFLNDTSGRAGCSTSAVERACDRLLPNAGLQVVDWISIHWRSPYSDDSPTGCHLSRAMRAPADRRWRVRLRGGDSLFRSC